ncbi:hypothetical protein CO051_05360 [Candidatus Roizmanbacteria bacterium CG_4_9_14_0_2_um_filter_39_13]|uniref:Insertion element IS402-like domain-containing protein n=2 Tax=Candidatus Roizmaniibacteriota TaxID=1752723 RepID=A0A2M8EXA2_9BACT|nr:MAG: hypothetical protein COY15_01115 [Candidatus Roizmanbacteria bacterium CG_4_10_14_0_2_um_filter_39_12]PJC30501.1 MAG: hypothetical protein CO051_05360 [Candidatus Roizmanbacteria bacterium CG_4_9_14_0_2_um_filter_39_13]PJE62194.1 MAG: hypothetical protein COU87_00610 [Candidatus Roizmanbacteria bacterium CG10_big_fil_rev_8_21_14_0_10_39_12]
MRKLSDKQWPIIEPLLPRQNFSAGGRPRKDDRQIFEAIRWILTTGVQWNELPPKYGTGKTAWKRFTQWKKQGVWRNIWQKLLVMPDKQEKLTWEVAYLDGTFSSAKKGGKK